MGIQTHPNDPGEPNDSTTTQDASNPDSARPGPLQDSTAASPVIVGDVAIFTDAWGNAILRFGADGRHRIAVPASDRATVAAAIAGQTGGTANDDERMPYIHLTHIDYGDARTEIETRDDDPMALLRIVGGNGWTWLDGRSRLAVARALLPPGTIAVERGRLGRLLLVAELAHEWLNAPEDSSIGRRAEDALTHAVDALEAGDLDPLPGDAGAMRQG